jgi:hypothetical protein
MDHKCSIFASNVQNKSTAAYNSKLSNNIPVIVNSAKEQSMKN